MDGIRLTGKKHFVREWDEVDKLLEQAITNRVLSGKMKRPSFTVEEWDALKMDFLEGELLRQGATPEELEALRKQSEEQAREMIKQHEERLQAFKVLDGGKKEGGIN